MLHRRDFLSAAAAAGTTLGLSRTALAQNVAATAEPRDWRNRASVRYPDKLFQALDPRFNKYVVGNTEVERLWTGAQWAEGPVWFGDMRVLIFSDIPNNRMMRWDETTGQVSVFRQPSNNTNGNTRDRQSRLLSCEHDARRVTRTEPDGKITVIADHYEGKRLNAPNDIVVKADNTIWFTDPGYGLSLYEGHPGEMELPRNVYRVDPDGRMTVVADDFVRPNGLCLSPDEKKLYVCDTAITDGPDKPSHIRVFDITGDNRLANGQVFYDMKKGPAGVASAQPSSTATSGTSQPAAQSGGIFQYGLVDGIRADTDGNIWGGTGWAGPPVDGVTVWAPDGTPIGRINMPEICANLAFGGEKKNRLFIAGSTSLYAVYVNARGAQPT
jgi:gluconolactonase